MRDFIIENDVCKLFRSVFNIPPCETMRQVILGSSLSIRCVIDTGWCLLARSDVCDAIGEWTLWRDELDGCDLVDGVGNLWFREVLVNDAMFGLCGVEREMSFGFSF